MKRNNMNVALFAGLALAVASCGSNKHLQMAKTGNETAKSSSDEMAITPSVENPDPSYLILTDVQRKGVEGNNKMALSLFKQIEGFDSKVVSPLSVSCLMSMLANGAEGTTKQEIMDVLGCKGMNIDEMNAFYKDLMEYAVQADKTIALNIANYIAVNKNYNLNANFKRTLDMYYKAGVETLDFSDAKSTNRINAWCNKQTNGMIPSIIDQVEPSAVSYVMNAIFFNGSWKDKFDKSETKLDRFQGYTRDIKKVEMMHRNGKYMYMSNDTFSAVEMPYGNETYVMTVLLPHNGKSIFDMMAQLDAEKLAEMPRKMDNCVVDLKLPRFNSELQLSLNDIISKMGASKMFEPAQAQFTHFANGNFYVSKMLQKAKIEVSEEGTKAAAVTAAVMTMSAFHPEEPRHVEFHANRPFVYMITEKMSGAIFFMGQFLGD